MKDGSVILQFIPSLSTDLTILVSDSIKKSDSITDTNVSKISKNHKKSVKSEKQKVTVSGSGNIKKNKEQSAEEIQHIEMLKTIEKLRELVEWYGSTVQTGMERKCKISQYFNEKNNNSSMNSKDNGVKRIVDKMLSNYKNIALIHLIRSEERRVGKEC